MEGLFIIRQNFMIPPFLSQPVYNIPVLVLPEHVLLCDIHIPNKIREEDLFHPQHSYILNSVLWDSRFLNCFWPSDIAFLQPSFGGTSEVGRDQNNYIHAGNQSLLTFSRAVIPKSWLQKLPTCLMIWPPLLCTCQKHLLKPF